MSTITAPTASLTGELALARESLARRLQGVDPGDLPALRRAYDAYSENDPMPEMSTMSEIELGGVPALGLLPRGCSGDHVIIWLHGGGYAMGSSRSHKGLASQVALSARMAAIIPDYRLAPENPYPAALEDALRAYQAVVSEGVASSRIILAGDSAGAGLVLATALRLKELGLSMPAGLMLLSPWVDFSLGGWSHTAKAGRDPLLTARGLHTRAAQYLCGASLDLLSADMRGLPPAFIQTGEAEILLSDSTLLAERLGASGAPVSLEIWPDMFHVFQARYAMLSPARAAIQRLGQWASAHIAR